MASSGMAQGSASTATIAGLGQDSIEIDKSSIDSEQGQLPEVHTFYEEHEKKTHTRKRSIGMSAFHWSVGILFLSILIICVVLLLQQTHQEASTVPSLSDQPTGNKTVDNGEVEMLSSPIGKACHFLGFTNIHDCMSCEEFDEKTVESEDSSEIIYRTIPTEIGLLNHLRKINFHKNSHLEGTLPTEIGMLTQLVSLQLHGLGLIGTIPTTVGCLTLLESLQLQNNDFTGSIPATLASLTNLIDINLSSNDLSGWIPAMIFQSWDNMLNVWFQNNRLIGSIPSSIGSMKRCEVIFLSDNRLSGSIPKSVGNMPSMEVLMLHNNDLSGDIPSSILSSQTLLRLYVTNNTHLNGNISLLQTKSPINEMVLSNTSISGTIPKSLCRLHQGYVYYEIDCEQDSTANKTKIQCNCCLSYDGKACPDETWIPEFH